MFEYGTELLMLERGERSALCRFERRISASKAKAKAQQSAALTGGSLQDDVRQVRVWNSGNW